jgi:response regulator RpfG family c-di-GMP phosphodiesterase
MADSDIVPLPPTPAEAGLPHLYVLNTNPEFLDLIRDVLEDTRIHVTVEQMRPNVAVTQDNLRTAQPDLVVVDVVPSHEDAARLLAELAATPDLQDLPIMLASTSPQIAEALAQQYPEQVREVLSKPFDLDDLFAKLSEFVELRARET